MFIANGQSNNLRHTMPLLSQSMPALAQSALRRVFPARRARHAHVSGDGIDLIDDLTLEDRLRIETSPNDADASETQALSELALELARTGSWMKLADYVAELDQDRAPLPSGARACEAVLGVLRENLCDLTQEPSTLNPQTSYDIPATVLDAMERLLKDNEGAHALAALLARLHLDCAWTARGTDPWETLDNRTRRIMRDHSNIVHDLVTIYDPIAYDSPLLAEIQYSLAILQRRDLARAELAFEDWAELDPTNPTLYKTHAFYLSTLYLNDAPNALDSAARRAMTLSRRAGAQPYAAMYATALPMNQNAYNTVNEDLFIKGLADTMANMQDSPLRLIHLLADVARCFPDPKSPRGRSLPRAADAIADTIRAGIAPTIRAHLHMLYTVAWSLPEQDFLRLTAIAFRDELTSGKTVTLGANGLSITR